MKFEKAEKEADSSVSKAKKYINNKKKAWLKKDHHDNGPTAADGNAGLTGNPEVLKK